MKFSQLISVILALTSLCGCFNTELNAPEGKEVRILSHDEPVQYIEEYKNFYLFGGLLPVWTIQPEEIIEKEQLAEVRVRTRDTVSDSIITLLSALLPIMIFPQHVIIEGNREPNSHGQCNEAIGQAQCAGEQENHR